MPYVLLPILLLALIAAIFSVISSIDRRRCYNQALGLAMACASSGYQVLEVADGVAIYDGETKAAFYETSRTGWSYEDELIRFRSAVLGLMRRKASK